MIIGILNVQGDISEHTRAMERVLKETGTGSIIKVKTPADFKDIDALVIPGGESTTIGKLVREYKLDKAISKFATKDHPIMGTCAGMILLAREISAKSEKMGQPLLGLMDIKVNRNAFGRQRESFETDLDIRGLGKFHAVFIRAPMIESVGKGVDILSKFNGKIVMARQKNLLAIAFHPELTEDTRIHKYFLNLI